MVIAPSAYTLGGVQTWLDYLMPGLTRRGWHVVLGLVSGRHHDVDTYLSAHPYDDVVSIENKTGSCEGRISAIAKAISLVAPDIVVVVNIVDAYSAVRRLKARQDGLPRVVATLHGLQSDFVDDSRLYGDLVDGVICTNRLLQGLVHSHSGIEQSRVLYAPYGVELPCTSTPSNEWGEALTIAYVGRLERPQKRFQDVVEILDLALQSGLNIRLLVAGDGPEMSWLKEELESRDLSHYVQILGELHQSRMVNDVYAVADVLLITSSWETGPIVAWEAMARGMVVISSRFIGSGNEGGLVAGLNCLMFEVGDAVAAVGCIKQLEQADQVDLLRRNARAVVSNRYTRERSIEQWAGQLETIMKLEPRRHFGRQVESRKANGRLDRVLGTRIGEWVRKALGKEFVHQEAGGEWPHTYARLQHEDGDFLTTARRLDRCQ